MNTLSTSSAELLTTATAALRLGVSPRTLEKWRVSGDGPTFLKVGRRVVYAASDLDTWLAARRRASTSDIAQRPG